MDSREARELNFFYSAYLAMLHLSQQGMSMTMVQNVLELSMYYLNRIYLFLFQSTSFAEALGENLSIIKAILTKPNSNWLMK